MVDQPSNALPYVHNGGLKAYAVTASKRLSSAPDIPTVDEIGYPGMHVSVCYGLWAPTGATKEVVERVSAAFRAALAGPAVQSRLARMGQERPTQEQMTPAGHAACHRAGIEKCWPIVKAANIRAE